jgi:hypothetical protein
MTRAMTKSRPDSFPGQNGVAGSVKLCRLVSDLTSMPRHHGAVVSGGVESCVYGHDQEVARNGGKATRAELERMRDMPGLAQNWQRRAVEMLAR